MKLTQLLVLPILLSVAGHAQSAPQPMPAESGAPLPVFRVNVVSRNVQAVSYQHRSGATKVDFAGTNLMVGANGQAKVESKRGSIEIEVEFANLEKATSFGPEYLTYVLWAISPEGRSVNIGEVLVGDNHRSKLDVSTDLQAFAMIVTAEPYYAVRQPSNVVVLENVIRPDTAGGSQPVDAKYELTERGGYIPTGYKFDPVVQNAKLPLEFLEARNALRIAESEGAAHYASDSYLRAADLMKQADSLATRSHVETKPLIAVSRDAVQTAEDARAIAVKKMEAEQQANTLQAAADAESKANAQADSAKHLKEQAEADAAKAHADMTADRAASAAAVDAAQAETEKARAAALAAQNNSDQAETDKAALRMKLSEQLNTILETRETARGLIISMSDVLFDTGKYSLKSGAREKLAKVAGILLSYPGLSIEVGGYTDNVGADGMNLTLSENRAGSVRNYLVEQGVSAGAVTAQGFGNTLPVVSNDTSAGRQQNRRVELLVSGEAIGKVDNKTTGSLR